MAIDQGESESGPSETSPLLNDSRPKPVDGGEHGEREEATEGDEQGGSPVVEEPGTAKLVITLGSIYFGVFLAALDSTIIATLTAPISTTFNSFTLLSWLASGYLIANAGFQPISGKLTDIYGRRAGLIFANIFFLAGNLICGLAKAEWVIIFGRVISGVGGGCMNTIGTFVASDLVPLRRRGLWQGIGNLCFGMGAGLGGVFGGWMNDALNWRWAFLIQVPLVFVSGCIVAFNVNIPVKDTGESRLRRVDFLGATTLVVSLVLLLLGLNSGGNIVSWNHPLVYVSLPLAGVFLVLFVYIEERVAAEPIIPVRLLLDRTVAAGCITNWFSTMGYYAYIYYGPIYFQVFGLSATQAGIRLIPNAVGIALGSLSSGAVMRITGRYYFWNVFIEIVLVLAPALMLGLFRADTPSWPPYIIFFLGGYGYGSLLTVTLLALISAVPHKFQAVITSASYAARSTGSTIGIAVASAAFQNILKNRLWEEFGDRKDAADLIKKLRDSIATIGDLPPKAQTKALFAFMDALQGVWLTTLCLCAAGALASLFMRENKLHTNLERK